MSVALIQFVPCASNNLAKLNVCHSTFGICFQEDLNIGGGDVSFLVLVSAHSCPAVSFVFFYDVQDLAFCHGDGAFIVTLKRRRKGRQVLYYVFEKKLSKTSYCGRGNIKNIQPSNGYKALQVPIVGRVSSSSNSSSKSGVVDVGLTMALT